MSPEYPRLRKALSASINFAKFREGRWQVFTEISAESEKLAVRRSTLSEKCASLERAVTKLREAKLKDKPEIDNLEEANKQYRNKIEILRQTEERLRALDHALGVSELVVRRFHERRLGPHRAAITDRFGRQVTAGQRDEIAGNRLL